MVMFVVLIVRWDILLLEVVSMVLLRRVVSILSVVGLNQSVKSGSYKSSAIARRLAIPDPCKEAVYLSYMVYL